MAGRERRRSVQARSPRLSFAGSASQLSELVPSELVDFAAHHMHPKPEHSEPWVPPGLIDTYQQEELPSPGLLSALAISAAAAENAAGAASSTPSAQPPPPRPAARSHASMPTSAKQPTTPSSSPYVPSPPAPSSGAKAREGGGGGVESSSALMQVKLST